MNYPEDNHYNYCPVCNSNVREFARTTDDQLGCDHCINFCAECNEKHFAHEMKEVFILINERWRPRMICAECYREYDEHPADYEHISEEDPHAGLDLFESFYKNFRP